MHLCYRRLGFTVLILVGALSLTMPALVFGYSGSLSSDDGGITGTGNWVTGGITTIEWSATQNPDFTWRYTYVLSHPPGETSHWILEVSQNFTEDDLINPHGDFTDAVLGDYNPGGSNPYMPGQIHGIKFDGTSGNATTIIFDTPRVPVWGDFYAKDGNVRVTNTARNTGFTDPDSDPADPPSDGSVAYHILVPDTQQSPSEACCFPDGRCEPLPAQACLDQGGYPQGIGTDCDPNPCVQPTGACCYPDGSCIVLTAEECEAAGGTYMGDGTDCDPNECAQPTGACCFADGTCRELTLAECEAAGGTYYGNFTDCDPNPCTQPTGACCYADGSCAVSTADECDLAGGTYMGDGTDCDPNECAQPTGACCFADGTCRELTEEECAQAGGSMWLEGEACDPNPCPPTATKQSTWGKIRATYRTN